MTQIDELQLQRLIDRCQEAAGLCGLLERAMATNLADLRSMSESMRMMVTALRDLPRVEGRQQ